MKDKVNILGIDIDKVDMFNTLKRIEGFIAQGGPHQIITLNVDFVVIASKDLEFKNIIKAADLVVPDGVPLLWSAKFLGTPLLERVNGTDLVYACCKLAAQKGYTVYLLGAAPGVGIAAAEKLAAIYPRLKIAGVYSPPYGEFTQIEKEKIVHQIISVQPQILFVAFGNPKQERWIKENMNKINVPVCIGVGASFDFISGKLKRAPRWMQKIGLEWLHRLFQEPRRLWKRYLIGSFIFIQNILREKSEIK